MPQLSLFQPSPGALVDGERGQVVYTPGFVDPEVAARWFAALRDGLPWRAEKRRMYDRDVDVPRLVAHFRLGADVPEPLAEPVATVLAKTTVPYNSVGLNYYRDGKDSVAPHNDHLDTLVKPYPIALLSLGSTRRMTIRAKKPPAELVHVDLEPGSLLVMSYKTQLHYTHGIPKTTEPVGERISLAFRVKPDGVLNDLYKDT